MSVKLILAMAFSAWFFVFCVPVKKDAPQSHAVHRR